jgi:hypothetical protein
MKKFFGIIFILTSIFITSCSNIEYTTVQTYGILSPHSKNDVDYFETDLCVAGNTVHYYCLYSQDDFYKFTGSQYDVSFDTPNSLLDSQVKNLMKSHNFEITIGDYYYIRRRCYVINHYSNGNFYLNLKEYSF